MVTTNGASSGLGAPAPVFFSTLGVVAASVFVMVVIWARQSIAAKRSKEAEWLAKDEDFKKANQQQPASQAQSNENVKMMS